MILLPLGLSLLALGLLPSRLAAAPQNAPKRAAEAAARRRPPTVEELRKRYEREIAKPFVRKGGWILDYDEALARARREDKLVFAYFARSYAY